MAYSIGVRIKQLRGHYSRVSYGSDKEAIDSKRMIIETFEALENHCRVLMLGYEDDEVHALLKDIVGWKMLEGSLTDKTLESADINVVAERAMWVGLAGVQMDKMLDICEQLGQIRYKSNVEVEEVVVGFDDEVETLLDQLTTTSSKQFQIISIVGMAGLGKTTLARKLYMDPLIEYKFDSRAWTTVSQVYLKKDLLLGILSSFINGPTDEIYQMRDEQLGEKLYRLLKGRTYLVVLDDIWDHMAWNDIRMYFPDDKTGSRVLFTSRDIDISLRVQAAQPAHVLRLRTEDESWDIFLKKIFRTGICPPRLEKSGLDIIEKCEGLPLAITITAGLLKDTLSLPWWENIAASRCSMMVSDPSQYMDSLALSYNHLPPHLRPCFLIFGAFPEDNEIPITKLIWLWIAHGFIPETESGILEDVAEEFLMDLVKRCLVMTSEVKAEGHVKTCRVHDLLHDFCLRKVVEENVLPNMYRYGKVSSLLCSPFELGKALHDGRSILSSTYVFLRILDVESIPISSFPCDAVRLVNLRYLAIQAHDGTPQPSISDLVNLQMLIISSRKNIVLPKTIWNMVTLRHLFMKSGLNLIEEPCFVQVKDNDGCPSVMASLQTLSQVCPRSCQNIFSRTPNLRKLGFCGPLISNIGDMEIPNMRSLQHLQKLKLLNTVTFPEGTRSCNPLMFPENLKKLTLSNTGLDWEEMWTFAWLPNLEVLKLKFQACIGETWETGDAEFQRLKVLKLYDLDIRQWVSSSHNFPKLQRLLVHRCIKLSSIPAGLGNISTLDVIEVKGCRSSAHNSALEIQKEQESEGNFFLKVNSKPDFKFQKRATNA